MIGRASRLLRGRWCQGACRRGWCRCRELGLGLGSRYGVLVVQARGEFGDLVRIDVHGQGVVLRLEPGGLLRGVEADAGALTGGDQLVEPSNATMPSRIPPLVWLI